MALVNSQIWELFEWMPWYHNPQLQEYQDKRVLPYEMFPILEGLQKESVTWGSFFLFVLICEKKKYNSLLPPSNMLVHTVKYGWDFWTGVISEARRNLYVSFLPCSHLEQQLKWWELLCALFSICQAVVSWVSGRKITPKWISICSRKGEESNPNLSWGYD